MLKNSKRKVFYSIKKASLGGFLFLAFTFYFGTLHAQNAGSREITGTVSDANTKEPVKGVSVLIKNSGRGESTGSEGQYTLRASGSDVLVFSSVGYITQEISVGNQSVINVSLEPSFKGLEEVVAVGYQTRARGEITSAVASISGEAITQTSENNITQAIQGKIPGVVVNDRGGGPGDNNSEFLIRGKSTMGDNSPLIVIDGIPRSTNDFAHIASNDIASISVLKDASAAIYGARASNGVILITTKKGRSGKASITLNSDYGIQYITKMPKSMNSFQRATYFNESLIYQGLPPLWSQEALDHFKKGDEPLKYPNTDWAKEVLASTAPQTHHNLSIQGGTDKVHYYLSGDVVYQKGIIKSGDMNYKQYQMRSNIDAEVVKGLKLGVNLMGRKSLDHSPAASGETMFGSIIENYPWVVAHWPDGSFPPGLEDYGNTPYTDTHDKYGTYDRASYSINSTFTADYKIPGVNGLSVSGYLSYDFRNEYEKAFTNIWDVYNYDPDTDVYTRVSSGHSNGARNGLLGQRGTRQVRKNNTFDNQNLYHVQVNYLKTFGKHTVNSFAAYERSTNSSEFFTAYRQGLPSDQMPYLFTGGQTGKDNNGFVVDGGRINYFGSIGYDYSKKYLVDFTFRNDGSFNFAPGRRFGQFPAVSAGWNIAKEPFMNRAAGSWLNQLKLRASWGKMGNDRVPSYQYLTIYNFADFFAFGTSPVDAQGLDITQVANPKITWETSTQTDVGIDFTAWRSLLDVSIDVFSEKRRDILIARHASVPAYTALILPDENLGKVNKKGFEIRVDHQNNLGAITYHVGGNVAYNRNKIVFMDEAKDIPSYQRQEGHPMDSWLVYEADGLFRSKADLDNYPHMPGAQLGDIKYVDVDGDGKITGNDMVRKYTSATPTTQFALDAGIKFKNFSLDIFFQGQTGAQQDVFYGEGISAITPFYDLRWTADNPNAKFPRAFDRDDPINVEPSTFWLYNASFLRLKNVRLMYSFPKNSISGVSNFDIYVTGRNLVTWDSMLGSWDPERVAESGYAYPQMSNITFGLNISL